MQKDNKNNVKEIAKTYGISLENIEQIDINGKSFFKFVDPNTNSIRMLENNDSNNLSEQFKDIQQNLAFAQGKSEVENAKSIFDYEQKYNRKLLNFISIDSLCSLKDGKLYVTNTYMNLVDGLPENKKSEIKYLLQVSISLNLKQINIDNSLAIDLNNNIVGSKYNELNKKCEVSRATVLKFENDKKNIDDNNNIVTLDDIDFDDAISQIEVSNDNAIEIKGEKININDIEKYYNYPELISRESMSERRRTIIEKLLIAYKKRLDMKRTMAPVQKQKILIKRNDGFANELLFSLIVGFASGVILTIVILVIKGVL